jgi:hypothetical protein
MDYIFYFLMKQHFKIQPCFQYFFLIKLKQKIIFRRKLSKRRNVKYINLKEYLKKFSRFISYSLKFIGNFFLKFQYQNFLKFLLIDCILINNWSNFFPKETKKQEKNFKILSNKNLRVLNSEKVGNNIEIEIQNEFKIELWLNFIYSKQYNYYHFQKNKFLEYLDKIYSKKNLLLFNLSLNPTSTHSYNLKKYISPKSKKLNQFFYLKLLKLQQHFIPNIYFFLKGKNFFYLQFSIFFKFFNLKPEETIEKRYRLRVNLLYKKWLFLTKITNIKEFIYFCSILRFIFSLEKIKFPKSENNNKSNESNLVIIPKQIPLIISWEKNIDNLKILVFSETNNFFHGNDLTFVQKKLRKWKMENFSNKWFFPNFKNLHFKINCKNKKFLTNFFKTIENRGNKSKIKFILSENLFFVCFVLNKFFIEYLECFFSGDLLSNKNRINEYYHILVVYHIYYENILFL